MIMMLNPLERAGIKRAGIKRAGIKVNYFDRSN